MADLGETAVVFMHASFDVTDLGADPSVKGTFVGTVTVKRTFSYGQAFGATGGVSTINGQSQAAPVPFQVWG